MRNFWGDDISLFLYDTNEASVIGPDLSSVIASLTFSTERPGGYRSLSVSFSELLPAHFWRPFAMAVVTINGTVAWEGRVNPPRFTGRWLTSFTASGYGFAAMEDQPYVSDNATTATSGTVLRDVIASAAPLISFNSDATTSDPAGTHAYLDFHLMTPKAVLEQLQSEGTAEGKPIDWYVWEGRRLYLSDGTRPDAADYHLSLDDPGITIEPRDDLLAGYVMVRYTAEASGTETFVTGSYTRGPFYHDLGVTPTRDQITINPVDDSDGATWYAKQITDSEFYVFAYVPTASGGEQLSVDTDFEWRVSVPDCETDWSAESNFVDLYGIDRRIVIDGGSLHTDTAEQVRDTQAAIANTRRFAVTIRRENAQGLPAPNGANLVPFWQTTADSWVRIHDGDNDMTWLPIVATTVDPLAGTLTVTCGEQRGDFATIWRDTRREDKRVRERRSAATGARERRR